MGSAQRQEDLEVLLASTRKPRGATEPRLTKGIALALGGDRRAAAQVAEALRRASPGGLRLPSPPDEVDCVDETEWKAARRRFGQRGLPLTRRLDLVFSADGWCLAVEVKLGADLSRNQLEDTLRSDRAKLGIEPNDHFGVLVLSREALALGKPRDQEDRLLGNVRWLDVIEDVGAVTFDQEPALSPGWAELLAIYTRRGKFGSRATARPPVGAALQAVHRSLAEHLERHLDEPVEPDVRRNRRVVHATAHRAVIVYRTGKHGRWGREITVALIRPPRGGREATVTVQGRGAARTASGRVPAALDKLDPALRGLLDQALSSVS